MSTIVASVEPVVRANRVVVVASVKISRKMTITAESADGNVTLSPVVMTKDDVVENCLA